MFSEIQKTIFLKEKLVVHFPKRTHYIMRTENQIIKIQAITTQSTLSMKAKNKEQTN
jgi:hypothetical protein